MSCKDEGFCMLVFKDNLIVVLVQTGSLDYDNIWKYIQYSNAVFC